MIKFGVCGGPEIGRIAKAAGYDYFEWSVGGLLHPREDERVFEDALAQVKAVDFPCPALNVFIPGDLKITGPEIDHRALQAYVTTAFQRAEKAGVERIVFGSGAARRVPEGFNHTRARQQIVEFCQMMAPFARHYGVTVVIEPLNTSETNIVNTVGEGGEIVREVGHTCIRLLVDGYHWAKDKDTVQGILANADLLAHAHVATVNSRRPPSPDDTCEPFFAAIKEAGYNGRISIEGQIDDPEKELPVALEVMRKMT